MARNGQVVVSRGRNNVGSGRNKVGRGRKGQVEVENDQVGPGRGRKYPPVPTPYLVDKSNSRLFLNSFVWRSWPSGLANTQLTPDSRYQNKR